MAVVASSVHTIAGGIFRTTARVQVVDRNKRESQATNETPRDSGICLVVVACGSVLASWSICAAWVDYTAQGDKENGIIVIKYNFLVSYRE